MFRSAILSMHVDKSDRRWNTFRAKQSVVERINMSSVPQQIDTMFGNNLVPENSMVVVRGAENMQKLLI